MVLHRGVSGVLSSSKRRRYWPRRRCRAAGVGYYSEIDNSQLIDWRALHRVRCCCDAGRFVIDWCALQRVRCCYDAGRFVIDWRALQRVRVVMQGALTSLDERLLAHWICWCGARQFALSCSNLLQESLVDREYNTNRFCCRW